MVHRWKCAAADARGRTLEFWVTYLVKYLLEQLQADVFEHIPAPLKTLPRYSILLHG